MAHPLRAPAPNAKAARIAGFEIAENTAPSNGTGDAVMRCTGRLPVRYVARHLILFALVGWGGACAETSACPAGQVLVGGECTDEGPSQSIPIVCRNSDNEETSVLNWELTVEPSTIESGEAFQATLDGVALFDEEFLDGVQDVIAVDEINLIELNATIQIRSGATGENVALVNEDLYDYKCLQEPRVSCDPANDDLSGVPGFRSNSDCQPPSDFNPCGRFIRLQTSGDCEPDGLCDALGKTNQCLRNDFCVTGDLAIPLEREFGRYTADSEGRVLFGWADETSGASVDQPPTATAPLGPLGVRVGIGAYVIAMECVMPLATPDRELVSFPIETP